jgi:hypothetical protein
MIFTGHTRFELAHWWLSFRSPHLDHLLIRETSVRRWRSHIRRQGNLHSQGDKAPQHYLLRLQLLLCTVAECRVEHKGMPSYQIGGI